MDELVCRELRPEEAARACAFTEEIFGPLPFEYWDKEPDFTASMAFLGEELVGVIPLSLRQFQLAPDLVVSTAWENAVGTREDLRSQGVGTQMILAARDFLRDRCDFLCVYRGAERSSGYRFYADKTQHVDLAYVPFFRLTEPHGTRPRSVVVHELDEILRRGPELARLHHSHWAAYGGYVVRDETYYARMIDSMIYGRIPADRRLHLLAEGGAPVGFAITALRQAHRADTNCLVMDFAVADGALDRADRLLEALTAYAAESGRTLVFPHGQRSSLVPLLEHRGFERGQRRMETMGYPLRPQAIFAKLAAARGGCEVTLDVWTPTVDYRLYDAGDPAPRVLLECKDRELCLLLASRLDGRCALDEERLTLAGPGPTAKAEEALSRILRCTPWVHPYLDWL